MALLKNIAGQKFNKLTAIKFVEVKNKRTFWLFRCDCGKEKILRASSVTTGNTTTCGCSPSRPKKKSNLYRRFYRCYYNMRQRCNSRKHHSYKNYGGRGIICLWKSFEEFKKDMYENYVNHCELYGEKNTTIERINNDGNYCLENCRWATYLEQAWNRRKPCG